MSGHFGHVVFLEDIAYTTTFSFSTFINHLICNSKRLHQQLYVILAMSFFFKDTACTTTFSFSIFINHRVCNPKRSHQQHQETSKHISMASKRSCDPNMAPPLFLGDHDELPHLTPHIDTRRVVSSLIYSC